MTTRGVQFTLGTAGILLAIVFGSLIVLPSATAATAATAVPSDLDAFVASLEGAWSGEDGVTPFGRMPFAVLFDREHDGSLHARSSLNSETYIDLRFSKDETGRWILHEEAGMEGMPSQSFRLVSTDSDGDTHRWVYEERPDFLVINVGLHDDNMLVEVMLRGKEHIRFELDRLPAAEIPALRQEMSIAAETAPDRGTSIFDVVEFPPGQPDAQAGSSDDAAFAITLARNALTGSPNDAHAHLALARAIRGVLRKQPGAGPIYAAEMLTSLQKAIELDPRLTDAYHWLVGYYLNAPPIAGGSIAKAEETARRLAEFDPEGGEALLEDIASHRNAAE